MSESEKKRPGCSRIGCCSCLVLIGLFVGLVVALTRMQAVFERGSGPQQTETLQRDLPTLRDFQQLVEAGELGAPSLPVVDAEDTETSTALETRRFSSFAELLAATGGRVVRVELDLDFGDFDVKRGEPGSGIMVETKYDARAFRFTEEFTEGPDGGGVMKIKAGPKGGRMGLMLRGAGRGPKNFVTIKLPPDVPLDLAGQIGIGETHLELGGLLLRSVDLDLGTGDHELSFSEPLLAPMESFSIGKSVGELRVELLGNASPSTVDINLGLGELDVDLEGAWVSDATVALRNRVGELQVSPPSTAHVAMVGRQIALGESDIDVPRLDLPEGAPILEVDVSGVVGEISLRFDSP